VGGLSQIESILSAHLRALPQQVATSLRNRHLINVEPLQWGNGIPIGLFWRRTDLNSLEALEPVLHTGEGPLAFRKLGISLEQAQRLIQELL
jgi:hypothetical protein